MTFQVEASCDPLAWDGFVSSHAAGHYMQSYAWGDFQRQLGWEPRYCLLKEGAVRIPREVRPAEGEPFTHVRNQYVIRVQNRDDVREFLTGCGIGTSVYYPRPLHLQPVFQDLGYGEGDLPRAEAAAREALALPMWPELTEEEVATVVAQIAEFFTGAA